MYKITKVIVDTFYEEKIWTYQVTISDGKNVFLPILSSEEVKNLHIPLGDLSSISKQTIKNEQNLLLKNASNPTKIDLKLSLYKVKQIENCLVPNYESNGTINKFEQKHFKSSRFTDESNCEITLVDSNLEIKLEIDKEDIKGFKFQNEFSVLVPSFPITIETIEW